jgi:hypothetical protein
LPLLRLLCCGLDELCVRWFLFSRKARQDRKEEFGFYYSRLTIYYLLLMLEVSFNSPQCGWMSIGFDDGVNEFHTTTAHAPHESALPELMRILTALADANSAANEYVLKWNRDPRGVRFQVRSQWQ